MPILRRILKFTPAVLMGMLVVAWVVSVFTQFRLTKRREPEGPDYTLFIVQGSLVVFVDPLTPILYHPPIENYGPPKSRHQAILGEFRFERKSASLPNGRKIVTFRLPLILLTTALLPLAIGPFFSFRFRLWHYLAYTALVAVELAYYLRWQE
jgi:hypothetical protein